MEIIGTEHVTSEPISSGVTLVSHVHGAKTDVIDRTNIPTQMMQARSLSLRESEQMMIAAVNTVHEGDPITNEASPQTDESCIVPSHSGWRGSLHRRIPNDGQITAWLAQSFLGPSRGTARLRTHPLDP